MKEFVVPHEFQDQRLDRFLKKELPSLPHSLLSRLSRTGHLRLDKKRCTLDKRLQEGQRVTIRGVALEAQMSPRERPSLPKLSQKDLQQFHQWIFYEDEDVLALNKPRGVATQGGSKVGLHVDAFLQHLNHLHDRQWKLVHRLDRDTTGVLLIAKNTPSARLLTEAFKKGQIEKTYWALTLGVPTPLEGVVRASLIKKTIGGQELMVESPEGHRALTSYRVLENAGKRAAFLELMPKTGRTHQLRAHLLILETPILGDPKYKSNREPLENVTPKLHLHAYSIKLPAKGNEEGITLIAPPDEVFLETCEQLGFREHLASMKIKEPRF